MNAPATGDLCMIGLTAGTLYRNVISLMQNLVGDDMTYLSSKNKIKLWGKEIHCVAAKDARAEAIIRGMTGAGFYGDEATLWHKDVFFQMLARMSAPGAMAFLTTNPDSPYHWLKTDVIENEQFDLELFNFMLRDNDYLVAENPGYIEQLEKEYTGLWYKRMVLGLWAVATGLVYSFWDDKTHLYDIEPAGGFDRFYVTCDYGTKNPFALLLIGEKIDVYTGQSTYYVIKEFYWDSEKEFKQKDPTEYLEDFKEFVVDLDIAQVIADPAALDWINLLKNNGFFVEGADNDVLEGIKSLSRRINTGIIKIHPSCINLRKEFSLYAWDPKKTDSGTDTPLKKYDHALDALRYFNNTVIGIDDLAYNLLRMGRR